MTTLILGNLANQIGLSYSNLDFEFVMQLISDYNLDNRVGQWNWTMMMISIWIFN